MAPTVSLAIMAHPKREAQVEELRLALGGAEVVWDQRNDRWDTGRRSMLAGADSGCDWHLVVQDDAVLSSRFHVNLKQALGFVTAGPAAFYMGRSTVSGYPVPLLLRRAQQRRASWIRGMGPMWGVAVAVRPADIPPMIAWGDAHPEVENYDVRMAQYFRSIGRTCWYSIPSLVNHRWGEANPSLIPDRGSSRGRTALTFASDRAIRWSDRALNVGLR